MATPILPLLADESLRERIVSAYESFVVRSDDPGACWSWSGPKRNQYGQVSVTKHIKLGAHRIAYAMATGTDPGELEVRHRCDAPLCTNPRHLELGTHLDNMRDCKSRGRYADQRGGRNGNAKLTLEIVREIKRAILFGKTNVEIAAQFSVHHSTISSIRRGVTWRDL